MTKTQAKALETMWSRYGLSLEASGVLDLDALFGRSGNKIIEIGFGDGHSLLQMAKNAQDKDFVGIEVYRTGVGNLLAQLEKEPLPNIRVFCNDAVEVLTQKILDNSLSGVQIFFADPWPKKRHHKRRLIQTAFLDLLAQKLQLNGTLHLATDWEDYALQMMSVLSAHDGFQNVAGLGQFMPRPEFRPLTKYEQRGLKLGHATWDLLFRRL